MALAEATEFVFAGVNPEVAFTASTELEVVSKAAGVGVEGVPM
jgi:hypothetical protein